MHLKNETINNQRLIIKILRFDSRRDHNVYFANYQVMAKAGMTVLDALLMIQEEQDSTLAFRYSCRGAVCGSCAMLINGQPNLACRVQLSQLNTTEILLEPLPNLNIIKDLIVDIAYEYPTDVIWESFENPFERNSLELISPAGKILRPSRSESQQNETRYIFKGNIEELAADWKVQYRLPAAFEEIKVPFEIKDIPLP